MVACLRRLAVRTTNHVLGRTMHGVGGMLGVPTTSIFLFVTADGEGRPGGKAPNYGQAVLHESGSVVQCEEQRGSQQARGQAGQLRTAVGSTGPEPRDE